MLSLKRTVAAIIVLCIVLGSLPAIVNADEISVYEQQTEEGAVDGEAGDEPVEEPDPAEIEISPESGPVGTKVYVTARNFEPDQTIEIYFSDITEPAKTWPTDSDGYLHTGFRVPEYPAGRFRVLANDGTNNLFVYFTLEPNIEVDVTSGFVGDELVVTGKGFGDDEDVSVYLEGVKMGSSATDVNGSFNATCVVPESSHGRHTIKAEDAADNYDTIDFVTRQSVTIEPSEGTPGTELVLSGHGFNADTDVAVEFGDEEIDIVHTGGDGAFTALVLAPGGASGVYEVRADDGEVRDYAQFTLTSSAGLSAAGDTIGSLLTVSGTGFMPNGDVTVNYDSRQVGESKAGPTGSFSITFPVPASVHGEHEVTVTDGTNAASMPFVVESSPPVAPAVLSPSDGSKAGGKIYFDWEDVVDPSGVMYQLEIAGDPDFTEIVVTEMALLTSEYLLSEDAELPRTGKDGAYYWRVKATDRASNASEWSTPRSFQVGFVFEMPSWATYALIGIGMLLAICIVLWILKAVLGRGRHMEDEEMVPDDAEFGMDDVF